MTNRTTTRMILGSIAVLIGGLIIAALIYVPIPGENKEPLMLALGIVLGWGGMVFGFYFGTSQSSADKTELLAERPTGNPGDPVHTEEEK